MPNLPDIILQTIIRHQNTDSCHIFDECRNLRDVCILNVSMRHFGVFRNSGKMLAVNIYQRWYALAIERLTNNIQKRSYSNCKQLRLVRTQRPTSCLVMAQKNKIR